MAMNRSLVNVLFGGISATPTQDAQQIEGTITKTSVDETAEALANADSVILVQASGIYCSRCLITCKLRWLDMEWLLRKRSMQSQK